MATISELVDKGDIPEERKDGVKKLLHDLGYATSRTVGKAFLTITKKDMTDAGMSIADANAILAELELLRGTAQVKSSAPDPLDTERFASASDYSKGENITPAKAQLQTIIGREKQRVAGEFRPGDPLAVNGRCQKRCLPVPLVCEAFGKYEHALRHFEAYQLTEADWCLYHDLRQVLPFYWPYEKSLQSAVLQSLRSAEHGLGRGSFGTQNLRVTNQTESDGHVTGITEVGILEFKRVEGPAELQIAKYCMRQMRDMRSSSSRLYQHSFMPMATCEVVGSELRFGAVWFESSLCATHFECIDMRLNASLAHERRVAVAIAGWMQLLLDLNTAALKIFEIEVQATARMAVFRKGFPYVLWDMDSKYQDIEEVVPRKLYKAWDRDNQAMVALKLVEVYGFEAASAWADHHVAVPSVLVRKLPGGFSLVSMPWLSKDQGWSILSSLSATQMESDSVWPAIQEMLGRAHAPYSQNLEAGQVLEVQYVHGDLRLRNLAAQYAGGQIQSVIMLDLDWAGIHGSHMYLADINPTIAPFTQRPASVQRGAVMLQEHDCETIWSEYKAKVCEHLLDMDAS
ncbi:TPA: hypothetical protein ACH3X1_005623 [Trebouxia sp. C0004]